MLKTIFKVPWTSANANFSIPSSSFSDSSLLSLSQYTVLAEEYQNAVSLVMGFSLVVDFFFEAMGLKFYNYWLRLGFMIKSSNPMKFVNVPLSFFFW